MLIWIQYHARQMQTLGLPNRLVREDEQGRNQGTSYNYNYSTYARATLMACALVVACPATDVDLP